MADITYTFTTTERTDSLRSIPGKGNANAIQKLICSTIETIAVVADGDTFVLGRIPSNARILAVGLIANDDLATTGSPTLDIGLASVNANITSDADAINNGLVLSSATTTNTIMADVANSGKRAWEFVSGQTTDPKGSLDVYMSVVDAATTTIGTITVEIYGYLD